jgi:hypothetical protein
MVKKDSIEAIRRVQPSILTRIAASDTDAKYFVAGEDAIVELKMFY